MTQCVLAIGWKPLIGRVTNGEAENELEESAQDHARTEAIGRQQARGGTQAGAKIRQGEEGAPQGARGGEEVGAEADRAKARAEAGRAPTGRAAGRRGGAGRDAAHSGARDHRRRARPAGRSRDPCEGRQLKL